ncbi:MAG: tetratricopeptide repeat protein [Phycisphaerae bacterium]
MQWLGHITELFRGRWQIPLALVALAAAGLAIHRLAPPERDIDPDQLVAQVMALASAGAEREAVDAAANLLRQVPPLAPPHQARLHRTLGEILHRREARRAEPLPENAQLVIEHEDQAVSLGEPRDAAALLRLAEAHEWTHQPREAVRLYRRVLETEPAPEERRAALKALVQALANRDSATAERRRYMEALLADDGVAVGYLAWALLRSVDDALHRGEVGLARALVDDHGARLKTSDLRGYVEYLDGVILAAEGRFDEAEPVVRWLDEWLSANQRDENRADDAGHLPALTRWLAARVSLGRGQPRAALDDCDRALVLIGAVFAFPTRDIDVFVGAHATRGRALAALDEHAAARAELGRAIDALRRDARNPLGGLLNFRRTLLELFEDRYARRDYSNAIGYLSLAVGVLPDEPSEDTHELRPSQGEALERLARVCVESLDEAASPRSARHRDAGRYFERAATVAALDEPRFANLLWDACQQFDEAGALADAERTLQRFIDGRSFDPRLPLALLMLGQTQEAGGRLAEALAWYRRVARDYPKLEESTRAKVRAAGCLVALDDQRAAEAERLLDEVLRDDRTTPEAQTYRDALYALCELLYLQERHSELIGRVEAFLQLYPNDPERREARFMLAHAYRRSAYALRDETPPGATREQAQAESRARFRRAATLFDELVKALPAPPPATSPADAPADAAGADSAARLHERLALFYRGDCLFELNGPEELQEALATYRQIGARFEGEPAALSAQVQLANIFLRLGKPIDAARALERARWLLRTIPDRVFAEYADGQSRADWERYLSTVLSSPLYSELLARLD